MATINNPKAISEKGEAIYSARYRREYELAHPGKFVAINIDDESATMGTTATEALMNARSKHAEGLFHLIRVGHIGAFDFGLAYKNVDSSRIHR